MMRRVEISLGALILCCVACTRENTLTKSFRVDLATSPDFCGDSSSVVAAAIGGHRARLNSEPSTTISDIGQRVHTIMSYRAEKVIFVKADAGTSWGEFL